MKNSKNSKNPKSFSLKLLGFGLKLEFKFERHLELELRSSIEMTLTRFQIGALNIASRLDF